jgi:hypothetical protein
MALRFGYRKFPRSQPIISLKGRKERPRPIIPVALLGPKGQAANDAVVDSAADDTVFPQKLALVIGVDLTNAPAGEGRGVGKKKVRLRFAEITLRLTDGKEFRAWHGWVGFTAVRLERPLLGFAGCLEYFTATFHGDREELELTVNSAYPGT